MNESLDEANQQIVVFYGAYFLKSSMAAHHSAQAPANDINTFQL